MSVDSFEERNIDHTYCTVSSLGDSFHTLSSVNIPFYEFFQLAVLGLSYIDSILISSVQQEGTCSEPDLDMK